MSFKYHTIKESDNHYVLPKTKDMKCDVHAFFSEGLYNSSEEEMWQQAYDSACYPGVIGVYLQPDAHLGYGIPVGGVVVTEDTIIQSGSGYDISCGILCLKVPGLTAADITSWDKRDSWVREVSKYIPFGVGSKRPKNMPLFSYAKIKDILRYGAKAIGVSANVCERQYIPIPDNIDVEKIEKAFEKASPQLGSIGSSNHYLELQCDGNTGDVYVMIHCGSRGFGYQTANYFFYEGAKLRGLPSNQREKSWLKIDEPLGKEYWAYHNAAANYAIANRHVIVDGVQKALEKIFKVQSEVYYEISHNLVQEETLVLPNESIKKGFVHRKGSTRAFPAGHPDLIGTKWEDTGHPCLIAGSMYDGAAILFPEKDAYKSGYSVNHGSGRVLGRNVAKKKLSHKQQEIDDEMKNVERTFGGVTVKGIVRNTKNTPLDECSRAYKNLDEVLSVLTNEKIATITNRLYPVANMKDSD